MFHKLFYVFLFIILVEKNVILNSDATYDKINFNLKVSNWQEPKRYLISEIKTTQSGIYKVEFHAVLNALYDLILYWGCKPMALIYEPETGFNQNQLFKFFQHESKCQPQIFELKIKTADCLFLNKFRNFIYIGHRHLRNFFASISQCSELFTRMHIWIIITTYHHKAHFDSTDLRPLVNSPWSQITFFVPQTSPTFHCTTQSTYMQYGMASRVDLYDVFYSSTTFKTEAIPFANWTPQFGLHFYHRILDEQGLRGRIVRTICPIACFGGVNESLFVPSYGYDLISAVESSLNVKHRHEISKDSGFGIPSSNNTFNGFLGELQRGEFDVSLVSCFMSNERKDHAARFSASGLLGDMSIAIKKPSPLVPSAVYFLPFQFSVWITITGSLIFTIIVMLITRKFYANKCNEIDHTNNAHLFRRKIKIDLFNQDNANGLAEKIVMLTLFISAILIFTYYTSILTSVFAYRDIKLPFNSMEELAHRKDYSVLTIKDSIFHKAFENAHDGPYSLIWKKFLEGNKQGLVLSFSGGFDIVQSGEKIAYFTNGIIFKRLAQKSCNLMFIPKRYMKEYFNIPFRKDFPFFKVYSSSLWKLYEGGIYNLLKGKYMTSEYDKCNSQGVSQTLEFNQIYMLFLFLLSSFVVSFIVLFLEIFIHTYK